MHGDERETILARVLDSVPDAVIAVDARDVVIVWNRAAEELFGWKAEEVIGKPLPNLPDEAHRQQRRQWLEEVRAGRLRQVRTKRLRKGGDAVDVIIRYDVLREDSDVVGIVNTYREAAAERRLEQATTEREQLEQLLDALHDGLAVVRGGEVVGWNRAAAALTGFDANSVLGHPPPLALEAASDGIEVTVGDRSRWIQTVSTTLPAAGEVVYLIRDITEQRQLDMAKDLFFASTSHELKTPLTVVKGLAATMRHHWARMTDEHRDEATATILRRVDQLDLLIDRILVGSRVSAGVLDVQIGPTELVPVVTDMAHSFDMVSPNHVVQTDLPSRLPLVAGDRQALDTILGHLIENAVKYSPAGGTVTVRAEEEAGAVRVDVLDEGVGLEGDLGPLLRPFVQGEKRVARRFGGVGIGLFIVGQLVEALEGTLRAANRPEGGACFSFTVPTWRT